MDLLVMPIAQLLAFGAPATPGKAGSSPAAVVLISVAVVVVLVLSAMFWKRFRNR